MKTAFPVDHEVSTKSIRSNVADLTLIWIYPFAMAAVFSSLFRYFSQGWLPVMNASVVFAVVITLFVFLRKRLSVGLRATGIILLYFTAGVAGHLAYGSPYALTYFVSASIMASVFYGVNVGIGFVVVSIASTLAVYAAAAAGIVPTPSMFSSNMILSQWVSNSATIAVAAIGPLVALSKYNTSLEERRKQAESANQAKSKFLAMMSHELRTPMTAVIGLSDLLLGGKLPAEEQDMVKRISKAGRHLLDLLNDILDFSKIEADKLLIEKAPFNPYELASDLQQLMRPLADEKGVELVFKLSPDLNKNVLGDSTQIKRILYNLIGNAIKFTERGCVAIHGQMRETNDGNSELYFQIADTGIGISSEEQARLFKPFEQAESGTARKFGGTGLGLSICYSLVELMGGNISVSSKKGEGATFSFSVPIAEDRAAKILEGISERVASVKPSPALNILVAEDNEATRFLLEAMLTRKGHKVHMVENGILAVQAVENGSFDIVLMDMQMPEMDGVGATQEIRKMQDSRSSIPIIALTADVIKEHEEQYLKSGLTALVSKPVNWDVLDKALRKWTSASTER
tara:strand:- start:2733 stop:4451 length:1719 start_codon:yes stop_codon:yes gene_type:complete